MKKAIQQMEKLLKQKELISWQIVPKLINLMQFLLKLQDQDGKEGQDEIIFFCMKSKDSKIDKKTIKMSSEGRHTR